MAEITWNDKAPATAPNGVSLGQGEYEVPFESEDPIVLANARSHPWLDVKVDADAGFEAPVPQRPPLPVSIANDPDEARKAWEAREQIVTAPVAIESGLDQKQEVFVEEVPVTVAAAEAVVEDQPADTSTDGDNS